MVFEMKAGETVQFNEVRNSGVFITQTEANRKKSMSLLQQKGYRALTYQEALVKIDQNPELKKQLKEKWFYLEGKGSALSGYYTFNDKGELTQGKGDIEKTVYVREGFWPLSLDVHTDKFVRDHRRRFSLNANNNPHSTARVVVGVRIGHEVAVPKIEASEGSKIAPELKEKFRTAVAKVEGVLDSGITDVFKEVLRAIE